MSAELAGLEERMRRLEKHRESDIMASNPTHRRDAVNLVHYLALRQGDVRDLQRRLGARGLSSLGRCEAYVLATVECVRAALDGTAPRFGPAIQSFEEGRAALDHNTDAVFGPRPPGRVPRIMVTLPTEAADEYPLAQRLVSLGMDVARINGAHDDPDAWERMARHVRRASSEVGRSCRVSMDLPGLKLRTGPLTEGPQVVKLRPERDLRGVPVTPAVATLIASSGSCAHATELPVDPSWIDGLLACLDLVAEFNKPRAQ
jgi:pyruvate kinase